MRSFLPQALYVRTGGQRLLLILIWLLNNKDNNSCSWMPMLALIQFLFVESHVHYYYLF